MTISIKHYFDQAIYVKEQDKLFDGGKKYCGHISMVPEIGSYQVLPWNQGEYIYHDEEGYWLMSNVCAHRQALILKGNGVAHSIVCNLHGWTYAKDGTLLGAPKFQKEPHICGRGLSRKKLYEVGGLLFTGELPADAFEGFGLSMDKFTFHSREVVKYNFNWKTFLEVYGEDYHVDPFHPGLSNFIDTSTLAWKMEDEYHVCTVGLQMGNGSEIYKRLAKEVEQFFPEGPEMPYGAVWHFLYPNLMVEFYPGSMVVAYVHPTGPETCEVHTEYFYFEEIAAFEPNFVEAQKAAYNETTVEDDEICSRMHEGRKTLYLANKNMEGPYHPHLEAGMMDFHRFYKERMNE
jgi:choline monooxygenase